MTSLNERFPRKSKSKCLDSLKSKSVYKLNTKPKHNKPVLKSKNTVKSSLDTLDYTGLSTSLTDNPSTSVKAKLQAFSLCAKQFYNSRLSHKLSSSSSKHLDYSEQTDNLDYISTSQPTGSQGNGKNFKGNSLYNSLNKLALGNRSWTLGKLSSSDSDDQLNTVTNFHELYVKLHKVPQLTPSAPPKDFHSSNSSIDPVPIRQPTQNLKTWSSLPSLYEEKGNKVGLSKSKIRLNFDESERDSITSINFSTRPSSIADDDLERSDIRHSTDSLNGLRNLQNNYNFSDSESDDAAAQQAQQLVHRRDETPHRCDRLLPNLDVAPLNEGEPHINNNNNYIDNLDNIINNNIQQNPQDNINNQLQDPVPNANQLVQDLVKDFEEDMAGQAHHSVPYFSGNPSENGIKNWFDIYDIWVGSNPRRLSDQSQICSAGLLFKDSAKRFFMNLDLHLDVNHGGARAVADNPRPNAIVSYEEFKERMTAAFPKSPDQRITGITKLFQLKQKSDESCSAYINNMQEIAQSVSASPEELRIAILSGLRDDVKAVVMMHLANYTPEVRDGEDPAAAEARQQTELLAAVKKYADLADTYVVNKTNNIDGTLLSKIAMMQDTLTALAQKSNTCAGVAEGSHDNRDNNYQPRNKQFNRRNFNPSNSEERPPQRIFRGNNRNQNNYRQPWPRDNGDPNNDYNYYQRRLAGNTRNGYSNQSGNFYQNPSYNNWNARPQQTAYQSRGYNYSNTGNNQRGEYNVQEGYYRGPAARRGNLRGFQTLNSRNDYQGRQQVPSGPPASQ